MSESCSREHAVCNIEGQNMYASTQPCLFLIKARLRRGAMQVKGRAMYRGASAEAKERGSPGLVLLYCPKLPCVFEQTLQTNHCPCVLPC